MVKKQATKDRYHKKIRELMDYIGNNLDAKLSLEDLSEIACFAPYHFHRIYHSISGETVMRSIRRLRLQHAAKELIDTDYSIAKIASKAGYDNIDSFTRKFGEDFDISPASYRKRGKLILMEITKPKMENNNMYEVEIKNLEDITLACIDHKGDYLKVGSAFDKVFAYGAHNGLLNEKTRSFGVYYDDPNSVAQEDLRSKAGFTIGGDFQDDGEVKKYVIKGGKYGMIIHKGSYAELENAYRWLYGTWLVNSEYEIGEVPPIEEYLNNPREVQPSELLTAIYIPLK